MNKNIFNLVLGLMFLCGTISAQEKKGDFLFKAMQDELGRNMKELSLPGMQRPFFMEYMVTEGQSICFRATLGSINFINDSPFSRGINVRVMVGDYHRTNVMNYNNQSGAGFYSTATTVDDNYGQIKRDLWLKTDVAYKKAVEEYSQKMAILKQKNLSREDSTLDDLSKVVPVDKIFPSNNIVIDKLRISHLVEEMSAIFKNYPDIDDSNVSAWYRMNDVYVVNSENSKYGFSNNLLTIDIYISGRVDGKTMTDNMNICVLQEKELPALAEIKAQVNEFAQRFDRMKKAQVIKDYYTGPVLFEGTAVASLFENDLLLSNTGTYATREPVQNQSLTTLQEKMDSKVISDEYTVKCMPFLKEYGGQKLVGHFEMDLEGIVPEKELTLIENGILKNVIGNRIPSKYNKASSGYSRSDSDMNSFRGQLFPGVVDISTSRGVSKDSLKKLLLKTAREKGYKYAYIIRKLDFRYVLREGGGYSNPNSNYFYRVNVADGSEELIRDAEFRNFSIGAMKLVMGTSNNKIVVNRSKFSIPMTIICPEAILLPDIEIAWKRDTQKTPPSVVQNPLKDKS